MGQLEQSRGGGTPLGHLAGPAQETPLSSVLLPPSLHLPLCFLNFTLLLHLHLSTVTFYIALHQYKIFSAKIPQLNIAFKISK